MVMCVCVYSNFPSFLFLFPTPCKSNPPLFFPPLPHLFNSNSSFHSPSPPLLLHPINKAIPPTILLFPPLPPPLSLPLLFLAHNPPTQQFLRSKRRSSSSSSGSSTAPAAQPSGSERASCAPGHAATAAAASAGSFIPEKVSRSDRGPRWMTARLPTCQSAARPPAPCLPSDVPSSPASLFTLTLFQRDNCVHFAPWISRRIFKMVASSTRTTLIIINIYIKTNERIKKNRFVFKLLREPSSPKNSFGRDARYTTSHSRHIINEYNLAKRPLSWHAAHASKPGKHGSKHTPSQSIRVTPIAKMIV